MFRANKEIVKDIKNAYDNLPNGFFIRIFTTSSIYLDIKKDESFKIDNKRLEIDNLKLYTKHIVMYDILEMSPIVED